MAGTIQTAPDTTPGGVADWENELNLRELSMRGYDGVSLTEWEAANTDKPSIAAGSVIEINGALCKYAAEEALTDEGGLSDGWCYIKHMVSGTNVTPTLTNTFGTWDAAKNGFYDGLGNRFSLFKMHRSGAVTKVFSQKQIILQQHVYDDIEDGIYIQSDSSLYPGQKLKHRVYALTINSGAASNAIDISTDIPNAYTNQRILSVRAIYNSPLDSTNMFGGENDSTAGMDYYIVSNASLTIVRSPNTYTVTFKVLVTYV